MADVECGGSAPLPSGAKCSRMAVSGGEHLPGRCKSRGQAVHIGQIDAKDSGSVIISSFLKELENFLISFQDDLTLAQKCASRERISAKSQKAGYR